VDCCPIRIVRRQFRHNSLLRERDPEGIPLPVSAFQAANITERRTGPAWAAERLGWWRGQWGNENRLHWVREVTFEEDGSRIRTDATAQVMAALRNVVVSL
jgi:hypothetical protein